MAQPHSNRKKTPGLPRMSSSGAFLHWLGMLAMVVGLFAPLATAEAAVTVMSPQQAMMKAAQEPFSTDTADFERVVLVGDFQQHVGCGDWDTNCDQTRLQNINGFWTAVFGVPAGSYNWELVAIDWNGTQNSIGEGQVSVAEGQTGLYAEFNSATRENNVWATTGIAYANGSFGDVALAQDGEGYVANALNITTPGWVDMQVTVNGAPVQTGAEFQQGVSRVTFDATGNITNVEHLGFAEVTVQRVDADGNPLNGSCFVLDGSSQSRGCDADGSPDGSSNGSTVLRFPGGFQPGSYTLRETRAAEGAEPLADQQIDVQAGQSTVEARSEGEPTPETGDLVVLRQDEVGNPIGGACFEITNADGEVVSSACDESGDVADDGRIGLLGVPAGDYTLRESRTPEGYEPAGDVAVSVFPNQVTEQVVQSASTAPETGDLVVLRQDDLGNPIVGTCFEILNANGEVVSSACDAEGDANDGRIGLLGVPAGDYTLRETTAPEGYEPAGDVAVSVFPNQVTEQVVQSASTAPETGDLVVLRQDDLGNPIVGTCFDILNANGEVVSSACDAEGDANDGRIGLLGVPAGDYTLSESRTPEGYEPAGDVAVSVFPNQVTEQVVTSAAVAPIETEPPTEEATEEATEVPIETEPPTEEATEPPTEEATEEPTAVGRIVVYREDDAGNPVGGSCFEVIDSDGQVIGANCDEDGIAPDDGSTGVNDVPVGDHTMVESRVPEGYEQAPDTPVTVTEGDVIYTVTSAAIQETEPPTEEPTEPPTEEATDEPIEEVPPPADGAALLVTYDHDEAQPNACVELESQAAIGMMEVPYACDNADNDEDPELGSIRIQSLPTGDFDLVVYDGPTEIVSLDPQPVTLVEGQVAPLPLESEEPETTSFTVTTTNTDGAPVAGVSFLLDDAGEPVVSGDDGVATFTNVIPGEHSVTMTAAPDGYNLADPATQPITVAADGTSTVSFQISRATTSFTITTTNVDGAPVAGVSFLLDDAGQPVVSGDDGVATFTNVIPGEHSVTMTAAPDGYNLADPVTQPITVAADGTSTISFQISRATTSFTVTTTNTDGAPVPGVSFLLDDAGEPVVSGDDGVATFANVLPGEHTVTMTAAPDGYNLADPASQPITVAGDGTSTISFQISRATTSFSVTTTNVDGAPVPGVSFLLDDAGEPVVSGDDGVATFTNVTPGEHTVTMTAAPDGYNLADPATQPITVATDGTSTVSFQISLATTNFTVTTANADGAPVAGVSFLLDDAGEPVVSGDDGVATFSNVTPGEHSVTMTAAPDGYNLADPATQPITVAGDGTSTVNFQVSEITGNIVVNVVTDVDGTSTPVIGACVQLDGGEPVCDADDGNDGIFNFPGVEAGSHNVKITQIPEGYDPLPEGSETQPVEVVANTDNPVTFTLTETPPATGNIDVTVQFDGENAVDITNLCLIASMEDGDITETACDEDGDGIVSFTDIQQGTYLITLDEDLYDGPALEQPISPVSGTVPAGDTGTATLHLSPLPTTGTLEITTVSGDSNVPGACFTVGDRIVCDDQDGDTNATPGVITITGIEPSESLTVAMSTVPGGYQPPANQTVSVAAGEMTSIQFDLTVDVQPGTVTVRTLDGNGDPLNNACYRLVQGSTVIGPLCDTEPVDGEVFFEDVPAGDYRLEQTTRPSNQFETPSPRTVTVNAGENTAVEVEMSQRPGSLRITTVDAEDNSVVLQGACFVLVGGTEFGPFCDADDGRTDGIVRFANVPAGQYELRQTVSTAGYESAANRNVTINPGGSTQITVINERVQPPAESGTLVVIPLDPTGNPVQGGCYQVFDGDNPVTNRICDNADDQPASITFEGLPVGDLTLRETLAPSPDWQIAGDIPVTIVNGETTTVEVPHQYKNGNVVVQAVNSVGLPLQGACFTLSDAGDTELCTDSTGQATVSGLAPGARELTQTRAPFGFKLNETPRQVVVNPGQTTTVRVVFENEPPPNTGTVQVQKFFCPAGDDGERTRFLGGAQGNQELKQTVGCEPGVASFTLVAEDGSTESNAEFSTNEDGRAQLTAVEGIYLLTETDPDLPGNSAARLRVGVGQMTTVIVINYVAPPAPAPVTINVEGYTCPPGFTGSSFVDFQNSCMAESQLTNQITVRAEAEARYKRSTGDTGVLGKTSFVELPAGNYTIWAERPHTVPVSYMFCGADVNNPGQKTVNGSIRVNLESGSTILCRVFQVPPLFDAEHGAIQVQKFNCPINERQRGYDYENECERATEPIPFEIVQLAKTDGTQPQPVRVSTNADGIVQFPMLVPGTYKLTEVDSEWCFAQSNSVDANGNVVVQKDKLSEVWVYNCVGTKSPPNTGSGDAAGLSGPDGGLSPMQILPNLIWPTVMLAGWMIWRDRKQA